MFLVSNDIQDAWQAVEEVLTEYFVNYALSNSLSRGEPAAARQREPSQKCLRQRDRARL